MLIHGLASIIIAAVAYPFYGWNVSLIVAGGVLIDIDHYVWYILKYGKLSMAGCYRHFMVDGKANDFKDVTGIILIFHTIEFLAAMLILSGFSLFAFLFAMGVLAHYLLDLLWLYLYPKRFICNHSIIHWIYKNKIQKV